MSLRDKYRLSRTSLLVMLADVMLLNAAILMAFVFTSKFNFSNFARLFHLWLKTCAPYTVFAVIVFYLFRLYRMIWTLVGLREMVRVVPAVLIAILGGMALDWLINAPANNPAIELSEWASCWFLILVFTFLASAGIRCSYRILRTFLHRPDHESGGRELRRVMVIGAGKAGQAIIREIQTTQGMHRKVVAVIDDNVTKRGKYLEGVPVVGDCTTIVENAVRLDVQEIIFAIPSAQPSQRRRILEICNQTKCTLKALPGIYQMIDGEVGYKSLKDVSVEDLLARDTIKVNNDTVLEKMRGKTVLVTGGGGSIGSELCRQIASHNPGELVIFDIFENGAYEIQQELRRRYPDLKLSVQIGSVRDEARMEQLFATFRPNLVFHAAAHKHVPLMEDSPFEAIKNNVFGTLNTAKMADKYHADQFLLISTDKAVNPTNIMGASKRLCENIVRYMSMRSETKFVAVRFGNVLGSNGSVVPLFRRQIEEGGPVTVTDKNIIRYFMTIPEAVSLILQAHAFAKNGEIYVLDMGEPVKIDDMARKMIRLSGLEPDVDIKIVYTGLRPGEKRYEELLMAEEGLQKTENDLIFIGKPLEIDAEKFEQDLARLRAAADRNDPDITALVAEIVPTYTGGKQPAAT